MLAEHLLHRVQGAVGQQRVEQAFGPAAGDDDVLVVDAGDDPSGHLREQMVARAMSEGVASRSWRVVTVLRVRVADTSVTTDWFVL